MWIKVQFQDGSQNRMQKATIKQFKKEATMTTKLTAIGLMLVMTYNINASGFENAFKAAVQRRNNRSTATRQPAGIPVAQATFANDASTHVPQATAQIIEERQYISIRPELQQIIRDQQKQEGTFDKNLLQASSFLVDFYQKLQEKRTPFLIDSIRKDEVDLLPHLRSVYKHLSDTTQSEEILAMKQRIQETIAKING